MFFLRRHSRLPRRKCLRNHARPQFETLEDRCLLAATLMDSFQLHEGQRVFWDGPYVERARVPEPTLCGTAGPCWEWKLALKEPGWRLRVAIDVEVHAFRTFPDGPGGFGAAVDPGGAFEMQVIDPAGNIPQDFSNPDGEEPLLPADRRHFPADRRLAGSYSGEVWVAAPQAGTWTVRVIPVEVSDRSFRMRAKLEKAPSLPQEPELLYPNLRIAPPFEATFVTPTVTFGPGAHVPGVRFSCMADEIADPEDGEPPRGRCLHFSAGVENVGDGHLLIDRSNLPVDDSLDFPATQFVYDSEYRSNPSQHRHPVGEPGSAGLFKFHPSHGHFHYQGIYTYQLWQVADRDVGILDQVGHGHKLGFAPGDEQMADWRRFFHGGSNQHRTGQAPLSPGWADIYEWNRAGQYVDFPMDADGKPVSGYYVIRGIADSENRLVETNENDNISYAYVRVDGETVCLVERGYGSDPWDRHKEVIKPPTPFAPCNGPDVPTIGEGSTSANESIAIDFLSVRDLLDETEESATLMISEELTMEETSTNLSTGNVDALFTAIVEESDSSISDSPLDLMAEADAEVALLNAELVDPLGM